MVPISETETVAGGSSAQVDYKRKYEKPHNSNYFDTGEAELGFSIDRDSEDVQEEDQDDNYRDPGRDVYVLSTVPELDDDRRSRDLSTKGDG